MMRAIVDALIVQSVAGGMLIGFVLLVRKLCAGKISARLLYALWLLVALRLLIPLELPGFLHLDTMNHVTQKIPYASAAYSCNEAVNYISTLNEDGAAESTASSLMPSASTDVEKMEGNAPVHGNRSKVTPIFWPNVAVFIWLSGVLLTSAYMAAVNMRYMRRIRQQAVPVQVNCSIPVYRAEVESPFLAGLIRKRIYINEAAEEERRLSYVLAHETAHAKNGDNWWLLLRNIACALYWFHPLVWLASSISTSDCEKACDERVVRNLTQSEKIDYACTLLEMSLSRRKILPMMNAVGSGKEATTVRIAGILRSERPKRWIGVLTTVLMLSASVFSCATGEAAEMPYKKTEDMVYDTPVHFAAGAGKLLQLAEGVLYEEVSGEWKQIGKYKETHAVAIGKTGVFIAQSGENADMVSLLAADGSIRKVWTLPDKMHIRHMAATDVGIALVAENQAVDVGVMEIMAMYPNHGIPYLLDTDTGKLEPIAVSHVYDLTTDEAGRLYLLHLDDESGKLNISLYSENETIAQVDTNVTQIIASDGGFYLSDSGQVEFINPETGEKRHVVQAAAYDGTSFLRIACHAGRLYAVNGDWGNGRDSRLISVKLNNADEERKLTIVNFGLLESYRSGYMERWWRENYPDIELNFIDINDPAKLATALMSGEKEFDIICGDGKWYGAYAASGAFLPLERIGGLMEAIEKSGFLPYEPLMSYNGQLYGIPFALQPEYFKLNTALMDELNLIWPITPYSWTDIADWAVEALEGTGFYFMEGKPAPFQYVDAKLQREGEIVFDTPQFRATAEAYKKLHDAGRIAPHSSSGRALVSISNMTEPTAVYAPLPTLEGEVANTAWVNGFYVSANTRNADLVEAFLTGFLSEECQHVIAADMIYYMMLEDADGYSDAAYDFPVQRFGQDALNLRLSIYGDIVLEGRNQYMQGAMGLHEHWKDYLNGVIDLDEYIDIAQEKIDLIQYE